MSECLCYDMGINFSTQQPRYFLEVEELVWKGGIALLNGRPFEKKPGRTNCEIEFDWYPTKVGGMSSVKRV